MKTEKITKIDYSSIRHTFCELTGWSTTCSGAWNADFSKPVVVNIEFLEQTCQHEQDWMCFYYPENYEHVTADQKSLLKPDQKSTYLGNDIYNVGLGEIIQWLVLNGELPPVGEFLVCH